MASNPLVRSAVYQAVGPPRSDPAERRSPEEPQHKHKHKSCDANRNLVTLSNVLDEANEDSE